MENKETFRSLSMDDIVFDKRNKKYGAFVLRQIYEKHLLKALSIAVGVFVFSMFTPAIAKNLGLFDEKEVPMFDTTVVILQAPPDLKPDEPPPPPPPPVEPVLRPTVRFLEIVAAKKEEIDEPPPPTIKEIDNKIISNVNIKGDTAADEPPPIVKAIAPVGLPKDHVYTKVEQMPEFTGGRAKFEDFISDNLVYPPDAASDEIQGIVQVYFVVNEDGSIVDVSVAQSSGNKKLDAEAVRLIKKQPKYKPGKQNGVPVRVRCVIPIEFAIE